MEPWTGHEFHEVVTEHRLNVGGRARADLIESRAGHTVTAEHDRRGPVVNPERDRRLDRAMVGRSDPHARRTNREHVTRRDLEDFHVGHPREIVVVRKAISNVGRKRRECGVDDFTQPRRSIDQQGATLWAHDPVRGDDVVEVGDVIAVQMRDEQRVEHHREHTSGGETQQHRTSAVDKQVCAGCLDERCGSRPTRVGQGTSRAEQGDLHDVVTSRMRHGTAAFVVAPFPGAWDHGPMPDMNEFNQNVIAEFRANEGKVGGPFEGAPMILVTHTGAKSGNSYTSPLVYSRDGDAYVIIASKAGAPDNPQWFGNLVAHPSITVEVGTEKFAATARVAAADERARLYRAQADAMPNFDEYAKNTTREIPVVVLDRVK